ncbi:tRNA (adenosine(37)-N6)-dimethylallyltransferase MiaA [Synechococcus sp. MU1611]|uniref:tRNA (adenosine(37)-N6)-dimethylallyltransferase MiaA n=1 Tax=Synechococcus sp. MU1611 TaxID=2508345 RepID=UPI001CF7FA21|nr:tRNA (adenosine(37)-N6)-dimethylallyltransferase MiaA [Synechococcus sp. MU1611]MCB4411517.1 tRNA (adenosine(37)-N6)-dimethylallyltransferase MiaA [Synechococcus sp. MU1611]
MNSSNPLVIALLGPTASGKTALALDIAERLDLPVINVDSRQLYRGMNVGTAKPTAEQQERVQHHLLDLRAPDQPITLQEFQSEANPCISRELAQRGVALLVGGSGLYLKALTSGLQPPAVAPQQKLRQQLTALGQGICHPLLQAADPDAAAKIAPADAVRTQRALEVLYASGQPMSRQATATPPPWNVLELGLNPANLRQRIQQRTEQLYQDGLVEETRRLSERYGADLPLLQTIGYGEALQVISGRLTNADAVRITSQRTRQFAKRQRTWFRRQHNPHWLPDQATLTDAMTLIQQQLM